MLLTCPATVQLTLAENLVPALTAFTVRKSSDVAVRVESQSAGPRTSAIPLMIVFAIFTCVLQPKPGGKRA